MSDEETKSSEDSETTDYVDEIAARTEAYTKLLISSVGLQDEDFKKEALLMLRAVRSSFKTLSQAEIRVIDGGKA